MGPADNIDLSDERLVAYIDGELSVSEREALAVALSRNAEARERLALLKQGDRSFAEAFDLLLDAAPEDRLRAMYADLVAKSGARTPLGEATGGAGETVVPFRPRKPAGAALVWMIAVAAALLALVFTGGLYTGGFFTAPIEVSDRNLAWREAAARYVALFSRETLEGMPADPQQRDANLERAQTALGLPLSRDKIADPALSFRGTQLLQLDGKPLAQIAYLYDGRTPVALCIIRSSKPQAAPEREKRHGLNIVHWIEGGYGFMVIGDVPEPELARIAQTFVARFS